MEKSVVESDDENESDEDEEHCSAKLWIVDNYKIAKYLQEFVICKWCNGEIEMEINSSSCSWHKIFFPL